MKLMLLIACLPFCALPLSQAADLFTPVPPKPDPTAEINYKSTAELLKAVRSGEILKLFQQNAEIVRSNPSSSDPSYNEIKIALGRHVLIILSNDYRVDARLPQPGLIGELLQDVLYYELADNEQQKSLAEDAFRSTHATVSKIFSIRYGDGGAKIMNAIDSLLKGYSGALREFIAAVKEERRQAEMVSSAKRAEEEKRAAPVVTAMAAKEKVREQKLQEILASPSYKIWQVSLQVEEGLRMVDKAKEILAKDDAIQRESGVTDLALRRTAGERIVAGKTLVEQAFATYKKLGGDAREPEDVKAGADPARDYR